MIANPQALLRMWTVKRNCTWKIMDCKQKPVLLGKTSGCKITLEFPNNARHASGNGAFNTCFQTFFHK